MVVFVKLPKFRWHYILYYFILCLFHEKFLLSYNGLFGIHMYKEAFNMDTFHNNNILHRVLSEIDDIPAILMLNMHALNLTLNWLCNVDNFSSVHGKLLIFAFDRTTYNTIRVSWPKIKLIFWPLPEMHLQFQIGDSRYQMLQYFRAKLCAYLASIGHDFWIIQADTYWRKNLFEIIDTHKMLGLNGNLLFDQEGDKGLLNKMIAGGYFFVKASPKSECFFNEVSRQLESYYATDNNIMGALCVTQYCGNKCTFIPYTLISNWRWYWSDKTYIPALLQFDSGSNSEQKFDNMQKLGAEFVNITEVKNHYRAKCFIHKTIKPEDVVPEWRLKAEENDIKKIQQSLTFAHHICEWLYEKFPKIGYILRVYIFPYYSYYIL
ncbi:hypothetical protein X798_04987 [Onchocerca flexuosa]|uniref:Nucleotide-diphospho-sugar transferase domain-containing protein n=1 Tax=Onchocerca flexuosa TaxID=387005 RepID=A0A238BRJ8_9BILA|nr:hypothetical protein X798_04987 [Onchocerca flexuosa]